MQVIANFWGGDGYLSCTALLAVASMGILNDLEGESDNGGKKQVELRYRCMDFTSDSEDKARWESMSRSYAEYFETVFGKKARKIIWDKIAMDSVATIPDNVQTLEAKFADKGKLALGFTANEMKLNIKEGIYGKPHVGEAFHSDAMFSELYDNGIDPGCIVINCGGYKGGGTAATFIPMENKAKPTGSKRYSVVSGPSTEFKHTVEVPNARRLLPRGYSNPVDIFEADYLINYFNRLIERNDPNKAAMQEIVNKLQIENDKIHNPSAANTDYSDLNPKFYMRRFIDRIYSDDSIREIQGIVVNMKQKCKVNDRYQYDETCDEFMADNQKHDIHITNLLNALSIQEIARNQNAVANNQLYTFCSSPGDRDAEQYTITGVMGELDALKFYGFLAFSTLLVKYTYPSFANLRLTHAEGIISKWAKENKKAFKWNISRDVKDTRNGAMNDAFGKAVAARMAKFLYEFVCPALMVFKEIQKTNTNEVKLFDDTISGIVDDILASCKKVDASYEVTYHHLTKDTKNEEITGNIKTRVPEFLAELFAEKGKFNGNNYQTTLARLTPPPGTETSFLDRYQNGCVRFSGKGEHEWQKEITNDNVQEYAAGYCDEIIGYTYQTIMNELV